MIERVEVFKTSSGILEIQRERAFAWEIVEMSKNGREERIPFHGALWIIKNKNEIKKLLEEYENRD